MAGSRAHAHHYRHHDHHQGLPVRCGSKWAVPTDPAIPTCPSCPTYPTLSNSALGKGACYPILWLVFFSSNVYYEGGEGELGVNLGWVSFSRLVPLHFRASACACGYPSVPPRGSRAPQSLLRAHRRPLAAGTRRCAQDLARGARRSIRVGYLRFSLFARRRISLACPRGSRRRRPCGD